jgi:hypothetical protein
VKVLRLCWLGIPSQEYEPMVRLFRDVMDLQVDTTAHGATPPRTSTAGGTWLLFAFGQDQP